MFYYLLARNVNISKNMEQVASITVIKYIVFIFIGKIIERTYLEPGFLTPFIVAIIIFDLLFSIIHHYNISSNKNDIFWDDDVVQSDFSKDMYENEVKEIRKQFGKRVPQHTTIEKPFDLDNSNINFMNNVTNKTESDELDTEDLEGAIKKILSNTKYKEIPETEDSIKSESIQKIGINILSNFSEEDIDNLFVKSNDDAKLDQKI